MFKLLTSSRFYDFRFLTGALCVIFRVALKLILFKILLQSLDRVYLQWRKIKEKCSNLFFDRKSSNFEPPPSHNRGEEGNVH